MKVLAVAVTVSGVLMLVGSLAALWCWALFGMSREVGHAWFVTSFVGGCLCIASPLVWMEVTE